MTVEVNRFPSIKTTISMDGDRKKDPVHESSHLHGREAIEKRIVL